MHGLVSKMNVDSFGSPQCRTLYEHLVDVGANGISQLEASMLYRIHALPRRIADLKELGVKIHKERRKDRTGHRYVRYYLADAVKYAEAA